MDSALALVKKFGPPGALGYAGARVAQQLTSSSGTLIRVGVGVAMTAAGVWLGMKFSK